jgi:hypothetical protein
VLGAGAAAEIKTYGQVTSTSRGTSLTLPGVGNTMTGWVQLAASTDFEAAGFWIMVSFDFVASGDGAVLFDVGIGGAGSEVTIIQSLVSYSDFNGMSNAYYVPLTLPAGSRVAVRAQHPGTVTNTLYFTLTLISQTILGHPGFGHCETYGDDRAATNGVQVTTTAANSKGAWAELEASITSQARALLVVTFGGNNSGRCLDDVGVGAAASEVVVVPDLAGSPDITIVGKEGQWLVPVSIPAGSRLVGRTANANGSNNFHYMICYGFS